MPNIQPPPITLQDLQAFQAKHFPAHALIAPTPAHYLSRFQAQQEPLTKQGHAPQEGDLTANTHEHESEYDGYDYDDDDDGLGYYPDGVKRTLTDEQIRIFRHSEIHALLRQKELREEAERERREEEEAEEEARRAEKSLGDDCSAEAEAEAETGGVADSEVLGAVDASAGADAVGSADTTVQEADTTTEHPPTHENRSSGRKRPRDDDASPMDYGDSGSGGQQQQQHALSYSAGRNGPSSDPYVDPSRRAALFTKRKIISYDD
ncbi:uncharacterized protein BP01DRAFT_193683 [Aspergillus saccharolyticus JOP 1030-1]|uniref:Uncharacterized protein n=1 Tax=Aspergillus saccharolyticus JOP 1030-1 TaxID=1450539 RepID=A0A318ZLA3_9EURO|nr:hypothetical protein BP01DRAFT_193683 [Aspergillus saccharolyticus JOP 1030-1]PYH47657.1 hypothetical protein BP01DRAFT_193683 [Aspergillus saccharolyticus JOP 1030-1]